MTNMSTPPHLGGNVGVCDERPPKLAHSKDEAPTCVSAPQFALISCLALLGTALVVGLAATLRQGGWPFL